MNKTKKFIENNIITKNHTKNIISNQETTNFTWEQFNISSLSKVEENTEIIENKLFKITSSSLLKTPIGSNASESKESKKEVFLDKEKVTEELEPWANISLAQEEVENKTGFDITNDTEKNMNNNDRQGRNAKPKLEMKKGIESFVTSLNFLTPFCLQHNVLNLTFSKLDYLI